MKKARRDGRVRVRVRDEFKRKVELAMAIDARTNVTFMQYLEELVTDDEQGRENRRRLGKATEYLSEERVRFQHGKQ